MEEYKVRRFVNDKEVRELTQEQKKMMAVTVIRAIGAKEKKNSPVRFRAGRTSIKWDQCK